jgi:haloacetate dehalogenase
VALVLLRPVRQARTAINADPEAWYGAGPELATSKGEENYADYLSAIHDPAVLGAMLEDYRAGLRVDAEADDTDRAAGRRLSCPTLVAWSTGDDLPDLYGDPAAVWHDWADDVRVVAINSGHHMAEQAPEELAAALTDFFGDDRRRWPLAPGPR